MVQLSNARIKFKSRFHPIPTKDFGITGHCLALWQAPVGGPITCATAAVAAATEACAEVALTIIGDTAGAIALPSVRVPPVATPVSAASFK